MYLLLICNNMICFANNWLLVYVPSTVEATSRGERGNWFWGLRGGNKNASPRRKGFACLLALYVIAPDAEAHFIPLSSHGA